MAPTRRDALVALAVSGLCSCGGHTSQSAADDAEAVSSELYRSGDRLRARVFEADGTRHRVGWYDAELDSDCAFHTTQDGALRCVPQGDSLQAARFADAACSVPVAVVDACTPWQPYAAVGLPGPSTAPTAGVAPVACGNTLEAQPPQGNLVGSYRLGAPLPPQATYMMAGGVCVPSASDFRVEITLYELEQVAPSSLVSATRHVETRGAELAVEIFEGDDGSRYLGRTFDAVRQRPCIPSSMYQILDDYRCYGATTSRVADVGCSRFGSLTGCHDEIVLELGQNLAPVFFRMGTEQAVSSVLSRDGHSCNFGDTFPVAQGLHFYELGAPFPVEGFPELTSESIGEGRLRLSVSRATDDDRALFVNPAVGQSRTARFRSGTFWDAELESACEPRRFADGVTRCVPVQSPLASHYADPSCQIAILANTELQPECFVYELGSATCGSADVRALYRPGPLQSRAGVYTRVSGLCELASVAFGSYYDLIPADASLLAALTPRIE